MVEVKKATIEVQASQGFTLSETLTKQRTFNDSVGILLRSYSRAIQKQEDRTGSLFQKNTKSICLNDSQLMPSWFNSSSGTVINIQNPERDHPNACFEYIHQNPVKNGLVKNPEEWEYSSCKDYKSMNMNAIINIERARRLGLII